MNTGPADNKETQPNEELVPYRLTGMLKDWLEKLSADPQHLEQVNFILRTVDNYGEQLKQSALHGNNMPARSTHQAIDQVFAAAPAGEKNGIQCKAGCNACCYIDATIAESEAALIVAYCDKNKISIDTDYLERQSATGRESFSEVSKCVFLQNDLCSIYEVRPSTCRKHFVKNDPALCDFSQNKDIPLVTYFNLQSEMIASALMNISQTGPIEKMLLNALKNKI
jgi:Fe-S-cluster containining protein